MNRLTIALLSGLALSMGAAQPLLGADASAPAEDPFVLGIDTGRMIVFTDKIEAALDIDRAEGDPATPPSAQDEIQSAAANVRTAALAFMSLKARACVEGKFTDISCTPTPPPAWLSEPANAPVTAEEVRKRSDALYADMGPLLNAACAYGREKMNDDLFCSVE